MVPSFKCHQVLRNRNVMIGPELKTVTTLLLLTVISSIGFGYVCGKELTDSVNVPTVTYETHMPFHIAGHVSYFTRHNEEIEKIMRYYYNITQAIIAEHSQNIKVLRKANADLEKKVESLSLQIASNIPRTDNCSHAVKQEIKILSNKVDNVQQRLDKGENISSQITAKISGTNKQVMDTTERLNAMEAMDRVLEDNITASLMSRTGAVVWKIKECTSKIEKGLRGEKVLCEGPTFYTSQFGYKMQLSCDLTETHFWINYRLLPGEYDALLGWPVSGKMKFTVLDQSKQSKNHHTNELQSYCTMWGKLPSTNNPESVCGTQSASLAELKTRQFCKNDILYIHVKFEFSEQIV